ncbi:putative AC9 transposase [Trichinella pseudospiralis]
MKQMAMSFDEEIMPEIKKRLKEEKDSGRKFCLSLDEWTSCGSKRYLCLNVHTANKAYAVGMIRINGSVTVSDIIQIILEKFELFELDMKSDDHDMIC